MTTDTEAMRAALDELVKVIEAAGLLNLSDGVQLGQTVWFVKASDALQNAKAALALPQGADPSPLTEEKAREESDPARGYSATRRALSHALTFFRVNIEHGTLTDKQKVSLTEEAIPGIEAALQELNTAMRRASVSAPAQPQEGLAEELERVVRGLTNPLGNPTHGYHCGWLSGREDALKAVKDFLATKALRRKEG